MTVDQRTIQTYDDSAEAMAEHFANYSDRDPSLDDIKRSFEFVGESHEPLHAVEIGCGAGRHAAAIMQYAAQYEGFDPSAKLLAIARQHTPQASFVQADAVGYSYPFNLDAVFAYASLLHVDRDDFATVSQKVLSALKPGGVFCMTLKESDDYQEIEQHDDFGTRRFYLYSPQLVNELLGKDFDMLYEAHVTAGPKHKKWMTLIYRKRS
jgi:SAM-dependent methyltransferase